MLHANMKPSEALPIVAVIDPDAYAAGTYDSAWVDMAKFDSIMATFMVGTMAATSTVSCKLQHASDAAGAGAEDITGKTATLLTEVGVDSDKQVIINCKPAEMVGALLSFRTGTARFLRATLVVAVAAADAGVVVLGSGLRNGLASGNDLAAVDEII